MTLTTILVAISIFGAEPTMAKDHATILLPVTDAIVTSPFGFRKSPVSGKKEFHSGVDLKAPEGTFIKAGLGGQVVFAGTYRGYGKVIIIKHGASITSHYGHCKEISVYVGQHVLAGEVIGVVGKTGRVTGPHLHFEIRKYGRPVDPLNLVKWFM